MESGPSQLVGVLCIGLSFFSRFDSLRLDRFDPSDEAAIFSHFSGRVEPLRLRLESQQEQ